MEALLILTSNPKLQLARESGALFLRLEQTMNAEYADLKKVRASAVKPGDIIQVPWLLDDLEPGFVQTTVVAVLPLYRSSVEPVKSVL